MGRAIVITSGKGGVGKTTSTANLGAALAQLGHSVVLIDADIGLRNLDVVMGLENRIVYHVVDAIQGKCTVQKALIKDRRIENLWLLPASQTDDKDAVTPEEMRSLVFELKTQYDFVLIDCPAGIEQGFKNAIAGADEAVVVATPEVSSIRDADRVVGLLAAFMLLCAPAFLSHEIVPMSDVPVAAGWTLTCLLALRQRPLAAGLAAAVSLMIATGIPSALSPSLNTRPWRNAMPIVLKKSGVTRRSSNSSSLFGSVVKPSIHIAMP